MVFIDILFICFKLFLYSKTCQTNKKSMIYWMTHGISQSLNRKWQRNKKPSWNKQSLTSLSPVIKNLTHMVIKIFKIINRAEELKVFNNLTVNLCQPNPTIKTNKKKSRRINSWLQLNNNHQGLTKSPKYPRPHKTISNLHCNCNLSISLIKRNLLQSQQIKFIYLTIMLGSSKDRKNYCWRH